MAKSTDGIEVGSYQTSGVNDDVKEGEAKQRGGNGSAKFNIYAHPRTAFAHKQPCCK
jgi:hypothetical protein